MAMDQTAFTYYSLELMSFCSKVQRMVHSDKLISHFEYLQTWQKEFLNFIESGADSISITEAKRKFEELKKIIREIEYHYLNDFGVKPKKKLTNLIEKELFGTWEYWLYKNEVELEFGYSDKHHSLIQSNSNPSGRHLYTNRPKPCEWNLTRINQKGTTEFYVAQIPINEIDAVSKVPAIKPGTPNYQTSLHVLDGNGV